MIGASRGGLAANLCAFALLTATATTANARDAATEAVHTVQPGETLNGIANRAGIPPQAIARANGIAAPFVVRVGERLKIPRDGTGRENPAPARPLTATAPPAVEFASDTGSVDVHVVQPGETLNGIAHRAGISPATLAAANGLSAPFVVRVGQKLEIPRAGSNAPAPTPVLPATARDTGLHGVSGQDSNADTHVVQPGETLSGIARRAGIEQSLIAEANRLKPPFIVKAGQKLTLPRTRTHVVRAGETAFSIAYDLGVPWSKIAVANGLDPAAPPQTGQRLIIPTMISTGGQAVAATAAPQGSAGSAPAVLLPAQPKRSSATAPARAQSQPPASLSTTQDHAPAPRFAWPLRGAVDQTHSAGGLGHHGIDIPARSGTPVLASAPGTVLFAGREDKYNELGNLVVIDHGDGWASAYGYLKHVRIRKGAHVQAGQRIGTVGKTGIATRSELHFELRHDGRPIDTLDALPPAP